MTIAISLQVNDGVVLAADSASTLMAMGPDGKPVGAANVYNNANKIFNLRKGLPIGAITWGSGSIGHSSIATLAKDLRRRFTGDPDHPEWQLNPSSYTIEQVVSRFRDFMFEEHYAPAAKKWPQMSTLGFIIAGYSSSDGVAGVYRVIMEEGKIFGPDLVRPKDASGITWDGQPEAIHRLVVGFGTNLPHVLQHDLKVPPEQIGPAVELLKTRLMAQLLTSAMPIQDAIDLAKFLVDLSINYSRFSPGAPTVGGPIEVAAITKHEGFKWVQRKHYFEAKLNPEG